MPTSDNALMAAVNEFASTTPAPHAVAHRPTPRRDHCSPHHRRAHPEAGGRRWLARAAPVPGPRPRRRAGEPSGPVLAVLREAHSALTPARMRRRLAGAGPLAYPTSVTILSRLHGHELVERFELAGAGAQ